MFINSHATAADSSVSSRVKARARISELDAQISSLEVALRALRRKRDMVQKQLDSYIYPVLTLPNEIVSEIFTHFLPVYSECPPLIGLLSPSTLGQVCREWREIAVSTPSLWRAIYLDLNNDKKRSGVSPFFINLYHSGPTSDVGISPFFDTVLDHTFHCEEMELCICLPHMQFLSSQNLPTLEALTIDPTDEWTDGTDPIILFDQAPNLTVVTLGPSFDPFRLGLPWVQITTLCGTCLFEKELMEVLRLAVNLVYCNVNLTTSYNDVAMPVVPPHMHLQDIVFNVEDLTAARKIRIFDKLMLPALRSLEIPESWVCPDPTTTLATWISRSGCDLEKVCIRYATLSEFCYREALPSVRSIVVDKGELELVADDYVDDADADDLD
ncbi:hypothetical protein FB451DRAFT_1399738 [Mycena latifolia]|nr:hypothetical protein FB451DRAFT_1399738 [Mycena latifolia]